MRKRQIILDFTSLLDVIMIILFFFILFSHFETETAKAELQAAIEEQQQLSDKAEKLLDDAGEMLSDAEEKERLADEKLKEAELASERQGENVDGIMEFSRSVNIKIKLQMDGGSFRLNVLRGDEMLTQIPKADTSVMADKLSDALTVIGYTADDTLLCEFFYNATEAGTASAYRETGRLFDEFKRRYEHFFYSETDLSSLEGE